MPKFLHWFGFEAAEESEDCYLALCANILKEGTAIRGYYNLPYFNCHFGQAQLIIRTEKTEKSNNLKMTGLDTHGRGNSIWDVYATGIDLTPPSADKLIKRIAVSSRDKKNLAVVNLVNADVLPSYLAGESIKMQMLAFPLSFEYFPDENAFYNSLRESGKLIEDDPPIKDGQILPIALFSNKEDLNTALDSTGEQASVDLTLLRATVKGFLEGPVKLGEETTHKYIRCIVDTDFGELEIVHMLDQVPEEHWDYLCSGATIVGTFVLSGDVAIYDYENGIIRDYEHNLKLLRSTLQGNDAMRLCSILSEDATYRSDFAEKVFSGKEEIVEYFNYVKESDVICYAHPATIVSLNGGNNTSEPSRDIGTRCLVLAYNDPHKYEAIAFIDVNEAGYITHIHTAYDTRYRFRIDGIQYASSEPEKQPAEE